MQLVKCNADSQNSGNVTCLQCGMRRSLDVMWADLDGPSFQAYYCPEHVRVNESGECYIREEDLSRANHTPK